MTTPDTTPDADTEIRENLVATALDAIRGYANFDVLLLARGIIELDVQFSRVRDELDQYRDKADAGERFKVFVHEYLDEHNVPHGDETNPHQQAGCRIGARLDLLFVERDALREWVERVANLQDGSSADILRASAGRLLRRMESSGNLALDPSHPRPANAFSDGEPRVTEPPEEIAYCPHCQQRCDGPETCPRCDPSPETPLGEKFRLFGEAAGSIDEAVREYRGESITPPTPKTEYQKLVENKQAYLTIGDIDKNFHRPECECETCEAWRTSKGRPTHAELRRPVTVPPDMTDTAVELANAAKGTS